MFERTLSGVRETQDGGLKPPLQSTEKNGTEAEAKAMGPSAGDGAELQEMEPSCRGWSRAWVSRLGPVFNGYV